MQDESTTPKSLKSSEGKRIRKLADPASCEQCGESFKRRTAKQRFCSRACYQEWWRENVQPKVAAKGHNRLAKLRAAGKDPSHGGEAAKKRGEKIALSNRINPRRKPTRKSEESGAGHPATNGDDTLPLFQYPQEGVNLWSESIERWSKRTDRVKSAETLVLAGHGAQIKVEDSALIIRFGVTGSDVERKTLRLYPGMHPIKKIIGIDITGMLTFDGLRRCVEQGVSIILLDRWGSLQSVLTREDFRDVALRRAQYTLSYPKRVEISRKLLRKKITGQLTALLELLPEANEPQTYLQDSLYVLDGATTLEEMWVIEARAANTYFDALKGFPIRWRGREAQKVPEHWRAVRERVSPITGRNKGAVDPANALLNYGYGILAADCRINLLSEGFDPACGMLHADKAGRDSLIYDLMEIFRSEVDKMVFGKLLKERSFRRGDFLLTRGGFCQLSPEFARYVAKTVSIKNKRIKEAARWLREEILLKSCQ
jgi:CRISPR-associated protein Cas1